MLPALLVLAAVFALLFFTRVGGARRTELLKRWPAVALACAALFALARGMIWPTIALAALSVLAWMLWPRLASQPARTDRATAESREDAEARRILGVGAGATDAEIRAAYRTKIAEAHPDRGGKHAEAARLTAARDRLLKSKR